MLRSVKYIFVFLRFTRFSFCQKLGCNLGRKMIIGDNKGEYDNS